MTSRRLSDPERSRDPPVPASPPHSPEPPTSSPPSEVDRLRFENSRLLDEIDEINRSHAIEIRELRQAYELELAKRERVIEQFEQRQARTPIVGDKDRIIRSQEARIDQLTERCQCELEARSRQLDKLSETLARLEKVLLENDRLRNRDGGRYDSPFRPDQARRLNFGNPVFETPETPRSRSRVQIVDSPRYRGRLAVEEARTPESPPRADGRRRAPPDHPALRDSLGPREADEQPDICNLEGMTVAEMRKSLASLEEEKEELGRKMSGPVATFESKAERQREEKEYDVICRMIARIKAELKSKGA